MKSLFLAVVFLVIGTQVHADSKGQSQDPGTKVIREYK